MKELQYLINDVREQTDNTDTNGIKDREIIRYFNDGIRSIQTLIFKNNPLCSYCQGSETYAAQNSSRIYDLPDDVFGLNAVSMVEVSSDGGRCWTPLDRAWPEEGSTLVGWFTRNKKLYITGPENYAFSGQVRVWYFQRTPKVGLLPARLTAKVSAFLTVFEDLSTAKTELLKQDNVLTVVDKVGAIVQSLKVTGITDPSTIFVTAFNGEATLPTLDGVDLTIAANYHYVCWGKNATNVIDLPDEVEPYLMDYVAQRISGRQSYGEDWNKMNFWTAEERANIMSIFADASQAETRTPITDTAYLRI